MKTIDNHYDYAILGGGGSGLSLLVHLHRAGVLKDRRLVFVEPEVKNRYDRTWSFWEKAPGPFDDLVHKRWSSIGVHNYQSTASYPLDTFEYKLIRSSDFYAYCSKLIAELPQVEVIKARAVNITAHEQEVTFTAGGQSYSATWAFSSLPHPVQHNSISKPYLDQHFRGWIIKTKKPVFDPSHADLMDFRTPQMGDTRFFYVLPFSETEAIVEIAIFSNQHLSATEYDQAIEAYLRLYWTKEEIYEVSHTEQGVIPMTSYEYPRQNGHLIYIGLGGGYARPSTGYTFSTCSGS